MTTTTAAPATLRRTGDRVRVTFEGRTVDAFVLLASRNGVSLFLQFDALLGGYAGGMPVIWQDGAFRDLIFLRPITIGDPSS